MTEVIAVPDDLTAPETPEHECPSCGYSESKLQRLSDLTHAQEARQPGAMNPIHGKMTAQERGDLDRLSRESKRWDQCTDPQHYGPVEEEPAAAVDPVAALAAEIQKRVPGIMQDALAGDNPISAERAAEIALAQIRAEREEAQALLDEAEEELTAEDGGADVGTEEEEKAPDVATPAEAGGAETPNTDQSVVQEEAAPTSSSTAAQGSAPEAVAAPADQVASGSGKRQKAPKGAAVETPTEP